MKAIFVNENSVEDKKISHHEAGKVKNVCCYLKKILKNIILLTNPAEIKSLIQIIISDKSLLTYTMRCCVLESLSTHE